jgi:hypothetical protein
MFKGKLAVLVAALLVVSSAAYAGIVDPCNSTATVVLTTAPSLPVTLQACPQGDGPTMTASGFYVSLTILDGLSQGVPNIPPTDFWMDDCDAVNDYILLCGGSASSGADSLTNAAGQTTMSNTTLAAGMAGGAIGCLNGPQNACSPEPTPSIRCTNGVIIIVQGEVLKDPATSCTTDKCYGINVRSFDVSGDNRITSSDLSLFAIGYVGGVGWQNPCIDYDGSNTANLSDLSLFALHFGPPGHECN